MGEQQDIEKYIRKVDTILSMKYLSLLSVIFLVGVVAAYQFVFPFRTFADGYLYQSPCDEPIVYRLGSIDSRFKLSKEQLQTDIDQATGIWGDAYGKKLFELDSVSEFEVNLVFDERQGLSDQIGSLENNLQTQQKTIKPEIEQYQIDLANFQKKVDDLNRQISDWNSRGGAPKDEYDKLIQQQADLKSESEKLNTRAKNLNQSTTKFNEQVGSLNQTIGTFNNTLTDKPEEGLFDPNEEKIDIFFNTNHDELVHTLTHEFGHALKMGHVQNPKSIMNARSNRNLALTPDDQTELDRVCKELPIWEIWSKKLSVFFRDNLRDGKL